MSASFAPIAYRDFFDVPRAVVVRIGSDLLFLDCPIDLDAEEYPDDYNVYRLPDELEEALATTSWTDLCHLGSWIGSIPVSAITFDESKRKSVDPTFIDRLERPEDRGSPCA